MSLRDAWARCVEDQDACYEQANAAKPAELDGQLAHLVECGLRPVVLVGESNATREAGDEWRFTVTIPIRLVIEPTKEPQQ